MYFISFGLLLTLFVAAVNCQSCDSASRALSSNRDCLIAYNDVIDAISTNRYISQMELNMYCQPSCRNLVNAVLTCDNDPDGEDNVRFNQFLCTTDNGTSCYDFAASGRFNQLLAVAEASGACEDDIPDGQTCSSACQAEFQNLIIDGGCCFAEVLEFGAAQSDDTSLMEILEQCPADLSRGGTCVEIGGASGLKAFVSVLLLAVALPLVSF